MVVALWQLAGTQSGEKGDLTLSHPIDSGGEGAGPKLEAFSKKDHTFLRSSRKAESHPPPPPALQGSLLQLLREKPPSYFATPPPPGLWVSKFPLLGFRSQATLERGRVFLQDGAMGRNISTKVCKGPAPGPP